MMDRYSSGGGGGAGKLRVEVVVNERDVKCFSTQINYFIFYIFLLVEGR